MSLISTIKSILGMGDAERAEDGTTVTVEREAGESAVDRSAPRSAPKPDAETTDVGDGTDAEEADATEERTEDTGGERTGGREEAEAEESTGEPVHTITGIGPAYAERLADAGIETVGDLASADAAEVADATDIAEARVRGWIEQAGEN